MAATTRDPLRLRLDLDLFEGPLDLLLTLVLREEVDLAELALAEVVDATLGRGEAWDPPTAGELVLLLSAVAELEARRLVGDDDEDMQPDPEAEMVRERLAQRLIDYAPFQRAAAWLTDRDGVDGAVRYRRVPLGAAAGLPVHDDPGDLAAAMQRVLLAPPTPSLTHLNRMRVNVGELVARLRGALGRAPRVSFEAVTAGAGPLEQGVTLLACLELTRRGEATLDQPVPFGDIDIRRGRGGP
ncbi:MAG: chromosome segregation protein ScpA [Thermoleophilia bacterium]